jgi:hypothetical protein
MAARESPSLPEPSLGMYALRIATLYALGTFALTAVLGLLLQLVAVRFGPDLATTLAGLSVTLTGDSRFCLIGFLTLATLTWNYGSMESLRLRKKARAAPSEDVPSWVNVPSSRTMRSPRSARREIGPNPYWPETWRSA